MAIDTLYVFLQYIINNLVRDNGGLFLIDSYIAKALIGKINKKINADIPYPLPKNANHIEYLIPAGLKLGRGYGGYYLKSYSQYDVDNLVKALYVF